MLHPPPPPLASAPTEAVPRRTLLVNIWPCQPPGAAHIPLPSLPPLAPHPAEPAAVAAIAAASSPLVLTLASPAPFERHLEAWRQQTLPVMPPAAAKPFPWVLALALARARARALTLTLTQAL